MAEYNPSKIIKDGNTYNFRDTTKIPLAGSNEISGSLIPSTDGTVNLGSPSYQWNNAYIKSLTINGVVCGDILTHNVSEFVNVTGAQTIGGVKTFSSNVIIQGSKKVTCNLDNSFIELDGGTTWGKGGSIVLSGQDRSSYTNSVLIVSKSDTNTDILQYQNGELKPLSNNTNNSSLGTPTNKWSKVYSDDVVHTTDNETIGGIKKFSDIPIVANGKTFVSQINASRANGTQTGFSAYNGFKIVCNNDSQAWDNTAFAIHMPEYSPTRAIVSFKLFDCIEGSSSYKGFGFTKGGNDFYLFPTAANVINLGSPSSQWNTTYTHNMLIDNDINIASSLINKTSSSGVLSIRGGLANQDGASIGLYGKDYNGAIAGNIYMTAYGNSDYTNFRIYPNGTMSVYNNSTATTKNVAMQEDVIPRSGGAVITSYFLGRSVNTENLMVSGGTSWSSGGSLETFGSNHSSHAGQVRLQPATSGTNFKTMNLEPSGTWSWSGTACQITSYQRYKQQITENNYKRLDAWEDVELVQFKYNESVDTKGKSARLHTGYVVQQIDSACKSHGVNISEYGLYCHEEYPEETEEVEVENEDGTKTKERKVIREASEHYSLRYTEIYAVECMYLRRCIKQLTARIEELEKGNNSK